MITWFRRMALAVGMFFLPLQYLELFNLGSLPVTPTKFSWGLILLAAAVQWLTGPQRIPYSTKHLWILAFGFSFIVSNTVAILSGLPFLGVLPYFTTDVSILAIYFVILILVRSTDDLDWVLGGFVLGAMAVGASGFLGYGVVDPDEVNARLAGLGGNPNGTAANLAVALAIVGALMLGTRSMGRRLAFLGAFLFLAASTIATLSRSVFLALPAMYLFTLLRFRRADLVRYTMAGLLLAVLAVPFAPSSVWERLSTLEGSRLSTEGSAQSRLVQAQLGVIAFVENPIAGVGRRNFINWARRDERARISNGIHNMYLNVAAEQGLIGLVPFLAILVIAWREYGRAWTLLGQGQALRDPRAQALRTRALGLHMGLLGILMTGLFHPSQNFKPLWILLGLSTAVYSMARALRSELESRPEAAVSLEAREAPGAGAEPRWASPVTP